MDDDEKIAYEARKKDEALQKLYEWDEKIENCTTLTHQVPEISKCF